MKRLIIFFLFYFFTSAGICFPKPQTIKLPMPEAFIKFNPKNALNVINLDVYQDSEDPNLYYYVPPFHIKQYKEGATSPFLNSIRVEAYGKAYKLLEERDNYKREFSLERIEYIRERVETSRNRVTESTQQFNDALKLNNQFLIDFWQKLLEEDKATYQRYDQELTESEEIVKNGGTLLNADGLKNYDKNIAYFISQSGHDFDAEKLEPEALFAEIKRVKSLVEGFNAGFLTVNTYAGFTEKQLQGLRSYKAEYAPDIRVTLLTMDEFSMFDLPELKEDAASEIFRLIKNASASGDYLGMAVYMDITLAAAFHLAKHLGPFVLPVGIKGVFDQYLLPVEAELDCDFSNGFSTEGRADVKDGCIFWDNDISNNISASDKNTGACNLKNIRGDIGSARLKALEAMEEQFESLRIQRTILAKNEKDIYYNGILKDIENNRRSSGDSGLGQLVAAFAVGGFAGLVVEGLKTAASFHWYTNEQNIEKISSVKFKKTISVKGHTKFTKKLPTSLCLVFNPNIQAYDRCTDEELIKAENMQKAGKKAGLSDVCQGITDPFECGKKRDEILDKSSREYINNDTEVVKDI